MARDRCPYCSKVTPVDSDWCPSCKTRIFRPAKPEPSPEKTLSIDCLKIGAAALLVAGVTSVVLRYLH